MRIDVNPPRLDLGPRIIDRQELHDVQAFVTQPPVKRFYVPILSGFSRPNEVQLLICTES